jgi:hypothetical protein
MIDGDSRLQDHPPVRRIYRPNLQAADNAPTVQGTRVQALRRLMIGMRVSPGRRINGQTLIRGNPLQGER